MQASRSGPADASPPINAFGWVESQLRSEAAQPIGLAAIPEFQSVLLAHLDPNIDPSLAIRALFGEWFPVLHWIDATWAVDNWQQVFPADDGQRNLKRAAWESFIRYHRPIGSLFSILGPLYKESVSSPKVAETASPKYGSYETNLAAHLMTFYWWGVEGAATVVDEFFQRASAQLRLEALDFIGRSLSDTRDKTADDVLNRLVTLFDSRSSAFEPGVVDRELQAFGWWLASEKFDLDWALERALSVLQRGIQVEPDHVVVQYLGRLVASRPAAAVRLLIGVIDNQADQWSIHGWRKEARSVPEAALLSGDGDAAVAAREAIGKLVARGHLDFRELTKAHSAG